MRTWRVAIVFFSCACGAVPEPPPRVTAAEARPAPHAEPLRLWNDSVAKRAILDLVTRVTTTNGPDWVPQAERVAVFDNDGTLWAEKPAPVELMFALDRVRALAPEHADWKTKEPFASALAGRMSKRGLLEILAATHAGMTTDDFATTVNDWIATARHPQTHALYTDMVYAPMLEVLAYLRANGFETFIVSGGGVDFMRPWTERVYGVPPERVVGSTAKTKYVMRESGPVIMKLPHVEMIDDKDGKPLAIDDRIGRHPIVAFGNSDGDKEMLEWTMQGPGARLAVIIHHDDASREYAYDRTGSFDNLDKAWDEAVEKGWPVVSMRSDWKTIYPR